MFKIFTHNHIIYAFQAMKIKQTGKEMGFNFSNKKRNMTKIN